jgi:hypothetical protein
VTPVDRGLVKAIVKLGMECCLIHPVVAAIAQKYKNTGARSTLSVRSFFVLCKLVELMVVV